MDRAVSLMSIYNGRIFSIIQEGVKTFLDSFMEWQLLFRGLPNTFEGSCTTI